MACGDDGGALLGFLSGPVDPVHPVSERWLTVINSTLSPITDLASLYSVHLASLYSVHLTLVII